MQLVVTDRAEGFQVFGNVLPALGMVFDVMQFQMSGIRRIPFVMRPAAIFAFVFVTSQNFAADIVGNVPVMFRALTICL